MMGTRTNGCRCRALSVRAWATCSVRSVPPITTTVDDPRAADVRGLVARHLEFAHEHTPAENVNAMGSEALNDGAITLFSARRSDELLAIGALKELDARHGELKSMHVAQAVRGQGIGRTMLEHLLQEARRRGYERVSLDTGTMEAFVPARTLYESAGFEPCEPFGDYTVTPDNTYLTLELR
jgi:putative acetyltransferase